MLRRTTAILTAALVLGAVAAPAALAKGPSRKGGKKPIGTVASFDGTTLTVTLKDGSSRTATADEDTRVKVDHRGRPAAKGNPTRGSLDDLVAGTAVLRMKTEDGLLDKVRIRRTATDSTPAPATTCVDDAEDGDTEEGDESDTQETEEGDTEETDAEEGDESGTEETEEGDTEEGDTEEGDESDSDVADDCDEADADDDADDVDEEEDAEEEEEEEEGNPLEDVIEDLPLP